ncbi:hypothetical protein M011DRAFT_494998 [Sporormia fimetaria CBS 119925]|uniref:Magnesium transporter n=1 Tax=Sporormia fimetaria CBS 119925 TaxID=1340428 RepID=A0A6A6V9Y6_9PLEO|nr:hypothetical protein M011DRAFT_494998 [Sporormia fimetaria CBS 119925]
MAFGGAALNIIGALFLAHAIYSAHEHTTTFPTSPLPLDITIELLVSVLLLSTGIVFSSPALKPIQWAQWSGKISREGQQPEAGKKTREGEQILGDGDMFAFLGLDGYGEGRRGFWDVRGKRKEYVGWVKAGGRA